MNYGCNYIRYLSFIMDTSIDIGKKCFSLCCEPLDDLPASTLCSTGKETMQEFIKMHKAVISESKELANAKVGNNRLYTKACENCGNYQLGDWDSNGLIYYVNFSSYPAPCQCKCIYCNKSFNLYDGSNEDYDKHYNIMFEALEYACENNLIAETALWQVSSGEITIHPYKERFYKLVKNRKVVFFTNCFIFDEMIAKELSTNQNSSINLSIDAGTQETWYKIKGFNNFNDIVDNLLKYHYSCITPEQITLKYIVLLGINDNIKDFTSLIEIMKKLKINHLQISRHLGLKYNSNSEQQKNIIKATGHLIALLKKNNITFDIEFAFTPCERHEIEVYVDNLKCN